MNQNKAAKLLGSSWSLTETHTRQRRGGRPTKQYTTTDRRTLTMKHDCQRRESRNTLMHGRPTAAREEEFAVQQGLGGKTQEFIGLRGGPLNDCRPSASIVGGIYPLQLSGARKADDLGHGCGACSILLSLQSGSLGRLKTGFGLAPSTPTPHFLVSRSPKSKPSKN